MANGERYYGWVRQQPDFRDWHFYPHPSVIATLPPSIDLEPGLAPVLDQGRLGSCGPNAADALIEFDQKSEGLQVGSVSRLFIYYNTRQIMGTIPYDSGVDNRTLLKALSQAGFCDESLWPYDVSKFKIQPPPNAYQAAYANRISSYAAISQSATVMKGCLASGFPFIFGFSVYQSFESPAVDATGDVPMPQPSEKALGGHDICIVGYDDNTQKFKFRNSWGAGWGKSGCGTIPYAYALDPNLSGDFWVINAIPSGVPVPPPNPPPSPPPPGPIPPGPTPPPTPVPPPGPTPPPTPGPTPIGDIWEIYKNGSRVVRAIGVAVLQKVYGDLGKD